jgi:repressor LexA
MLAENLKKLRKKRKMTLEELAEAVGTSRQTIHRYETGAISNIPPEKIELLAAALKTTPSALMGWKDEGGARRASSAASQAKCIPLLGEIACGEPIFALESYENQVFVNESIDADFCLTAHGDSMIGARIYDGDTVFIRAQDSVDNGQIAAVIINDEATLKRVYFYPAEGKLILSPENPKYAPLVYMNDELNTIKIIGKAIAFQSSIF